MADKFTSKNHFDNFTAKVAYTSAQDNLCWLWTGAVGSHSYGAFVFNGKVRLAHRVAYENFRGPIPEDMQVDHVCDVRICVRPSHLYLGTKSRNALDAVEDGKGGGQKLTYADATEIRRLYDSGNYTQRELGEVYGVQHSHISSIVNLKVFKPDVAPRQRVEPQC